MCQWGAMLQFDIHPVVPVETTGQAIAKVSG